MQIVKVGCKIATVSIATVLLQLSSLHWEKWSRLKNKYAKKVHHRFWHYKREYTNSQLASHQDDPNVWISNLEDLKIRLEHQGSEMQDINFMMQILINWPKDYKMS